MRNHKNQNKMKFEAPAVALARWNPDIKAAPEKDDAVTINIYDEIGETWDGAGITPNLVSSILRKAEGADVVVNINSPGGSFFDGLAIYNLLNEYGGNVTIKVLGMAASAASIIAMAGDDIEISEHAFIMIHNSWTIALGNKDDMQEVADMLDQFDESMVSLYAKHTGIDQKEVRKMMAATTWLDGKTSVEKGFATALLGDKEVVEEKEDKSYNSALRKVDIGLAKSGMTRSERRDLLKQLSSKPSATETITPSADALTEGLKSLLETINSVNKH